MEFESNVRRITNGSFKVTIRFLCRNENILKPAKPVQRANICRNSRRVELLAGMKSERCFCRLRCNVMKSYEFDFVDDIIGRQAIRCPGSDCSAGFAFLRSCEGWCDNEQPKKPHGHRSIAAHLSLHREIN